MAHLPPKAPSITQSNWHHDNFPHHKNSMDQTNLWVDDFLDFSSLRRGSHRRSMSDSIAFLETPMVEEECRRSSSGVNNDDDDQFDRFDDEQLMTMFTDDAAVGPTMSCSNTSSPSEHNSFNDDHGGPSSDQFQKMQLQQPKNEPEEVQSLCDSEGQNSNEKILDPKRIKRILANRQSAQKSRVRKLQYISELERSVNTLQAEVSVLSPRVAFLDHQRLVLNVDNSVLKQRIAALAQDKVFKDAHEEALRREIERLRQIYHQQNSKKMENSTESPARDPETNRCSDKEQVAKLN